MIPKDGPPGLIVSVDRFVLEALVLAVLRHRVAARLLEEGGPMIMERPGDSKSRIVRNPLSVTLRAEAD